MRAYSSPRWQLQWEAYKDTQSNLHKAWPVKVTVVSFFAHFYSYYLLLYLYDVSSATKTRSSSRSQFVPIDSARDAYINCSSKVRKIRPAVHFLTSTMKQQSLFAYLMHVSQGSQTYILKLFFCLSHLASTTGGSLSPHLPQCQSTSVSVALVSTLATVSVQFCLSLWSPHLPQCQSTSVSVALVSTLVTMSVHFCLCRLGLHTCHNVSPLLSLSPWSPHLPQCQSSSVSVALVSTLVTMSVHFCLCRLGLHTCHNVSPLLSLSPWSPHLPQCQSTASWSVWVTVRVVILTAPLNESTVNAYRQHSQNSCSYLLPLPGVEPESSGEHVSPVTTPTSSRASLSELNVTVHVVSASTRPTGQLSGGGGGGGGGGGHLASLRLVD